MHMQSAIQPLEAAILRTILYGDVFSFSMTAEEIHRFLIHDRPVPMDDIRRCLSLSPLLRGCLIEDGGYYACADRAELIALRCDRAQAAETLWERAQHWGTMIARLPFVRMVGITGALAMQNPSDASDDLDFLVVTAPGRVWLARAVTILLVRLAKLRSVHLCPNYIVAEDALVQQRQDLYIAHEVVQVVPVYGSAVYRKLLRVNCWTLDHLPNSTAPANAEDRPLRQPWIAIKTGLEWLLGGPLGDWLEGWEYVRKRRRFASELKRPNSAALLDTTTVKGHFQDHGHAVLARFAERVRRYGVDEIRIPAGD